MNPRDRLNTLVLTRRSALLALVGTAPWALAGTTEAIRISNGEWTPFMGKDLAHHGIVSRIVDEAFALEGVQVQYSFYPWARAYFEAQHGQVDASIGWYKTPERERDFFFSDTVFVESQVLFFLKDRPLAWKDWADLRGRHIGATLGYAYGPTFTALEASRDIVVERTGSDEQNLRKLLAGRLDAAVISLAVGARLLKSLDAASADRIGFDPRPINSGPLHVIFSKKLPKSTEWLRRFNRGLKKLKATGAIERYRFND